MHHKTHHHRNALASALALALISPFSASAQQTDELGDAKQTFESTTKEGAKTLGAVTVTGSRIKRAEIEGPSPVTIITADQIKKEGWANVYDMLTTLTQVTGTVQADSDWGSDTPNASPLNFRNLGPNRSLLLVNGRRVADYPLPYEGQTNFANYGNIPSAAVERIEVLSGGASAIYGSDAIGGVINVILKQNYQGDQVRIRGGTSTEGGRDTFDLSWAGGRTGERWSLTYALQYQKRDPLFGRDRPAMDDNDDAPRLSWQPEQVAHGGVFRPNNGIGLIDLGTGLRQTPPPGACDQFQGEYYLADRRLYNRNTGRSRSTGFLCGMSSDYANWMLQSGTENSSGYLYGTFDFTDKLQGWASVAVNKSIAFWGTSPPSYVTNQLDGGGVYFDAGTNQTLLGVRQFTPREVGGVDGLRNLNDELSWDITAGLRGSIADRFDWEASAGRSRYTVHERVNVINQVAADNFFLGPELGDGGADMVRNLNEARWWAPLSEADYRGISLYSINEAYSWSNQAQFTLSGELFQGWAGPIDFAGAAEWARQAYKLQPDLRDETSWQLQNVNQGGGERTRYSAGIEFRIPLLESLTTTLAGRYDRYGDYESYSEVPTVIDSHADNTWNFGLEWRPFDSLLVRGTYATSFHAPDMHYIMGEPSVSFETSLDYRSCIETGANLNGTCTSDNPEYWYLKDIYRRGTPGLESETGESWGVGLVWDAMENLSFTADYYVIKVDDMIRDQGSDDIRRAEAGCATQRNMDGTPWINPGGDAYCAAILGAVHRDLDNDPDIDVIDVGPFNLAHKEVKGIDLSARYRLPTANWGDFQFGLNYTNAISTKERVFLTDEMPERRDHEVRTKLRGSIAWEKGNWNAALYGDRAGSVRSVRHGGCTPFADGFVPNADFDCLDTTPSSPTFGQSTERFYGRVGPFITVNLNAGYRITDNMRVNLYVNNVTNATVWNHKDPYKFDYAFGPTRMLGVVGREWAMEYVFDFK